MSESYRQTRNYENLNRCIYPGVGEFGIPELEPVHCDAETWIGFNYAKGCDVEDRPAHSVHFFIDDYQFNRLWTAPDSYEWCFDGEPVGGDVIVSSVGTQADPECAELFMSGYLEMERRLEPSKVIFYGDVPDALKWRSNVCPVPAFQHELKKRIAAKQKAAKEKV